MLPDSSEQFSIIDAGALVDGAAISPTIHRRRRVAVSGGDTGRHAGVRSTPDLRVLRTERCSKKPH